MKRMHVHVAVDDLNKSISFYSALFETQPAVVKPDYAKGMLDDPRVNFAISARGLLITTVPAISMALIGATH
jgi:hypothetical protein